MKKKPQVNDQPKDWEDEKVEKVEFVKIRLSGEKKARLQAYADGLRRTITSIIMELLEPIIDEKKEQKK